ncbi:carbonyl reductase [NADPH] 3-like [Planococcus citri]|uniref:carbonyl reductase [NADPH] 3-like n=1 Tax=Planococcus citri TaxID=170843 RepID=UPI0031F79AFE
MALRKVAVVTGSNKGIGYAIVKGLCQDFQGDVYLTARDEDRGSAAVKSLKELGLNPKFYQLDITDNQSVTKLKDYLVQEYGGLDVLVNNAAIAFKVSAPEPFEVQAEETIRVNYIATRNVCDILFPILRPHARVVNVSSSAGHLSRIPSESLRQKFASENLTVNELDDLMNTFVKDSKENKHSSSGWGNSAYAVSKVGVSALTRIQQREFLKDQREDIVVNSVHPGYVDTDMSSHKGHLTIEQGAVSSLYAALLPENITEPKGAYIWDNKDIIDWTAPLK